MRLDLHVIQKADPALMQRLDWLYSQLERLHQQNAHNLSIQGAIMATIKELVDSVAVVKGKADSIGMLITQLREQITGLTNGNLPPDVQQQVDQAFADAEAAKKDLSDAVDNTSGKPVTTKPEQDAPPPANASFPASPTPPSAPFTPPGSSPTGETQNLDGKHT